MSCLTAPLSALLVALGVPGCCQPHPRRGIGTNQYRFARHALKIAELRAGERAALDDSHSAIEIHTLASASLTGISER